MHTRLKAALGLFAGIALLYDTTGDGRVWCR
ncbi:hypothetical protein SHIRM173S_11907 [Streptomyces hirsutus]